MKKNNPRNYPTAQLVPLTHEERQLLANAVLGYGNMAKVVASVGVSDVTIRHAVAGLRLTPPVHAALRDFLSSHVTGKAAQTAQP